MKYLRLLLCIGICEAVGLVGSFFTFGSINSWYSFLVKPSFAPPNWLFGPIWVSLYALMGASLYLVWGSRRRINAFVYLPFALQLFLNGLWSALFFGYHSLTFSFLDILFLWVAITLTMWRFSKFSKVAVGLLVPYLVWVTIASVLNYSIMMLNNTVLI